MNWLNFDGVFRDFFRFRGFKEARLKDKVRWVLTYPLVAILYVLLIIRFWIDR